MKLIYNLDVFNYYTYHSFNIYCSHINTLFYDAIKISFNDIVKYNISDIINICKANNLELIISFGDDLEICKYINIIENIEIFDYIIYNKYKNKFKKIIINVNLVTSLNEFIKDKSVNHNDIILIKNVDEPEKLFSNKFNFNNIGVESENINDIWLNTFGINIFSFTFKNNIANNEWSFKENNTMQSIDLNCSNYIKKKSKKILITGITGQDGSLFCEYLLNLKNKDLFIIGTIKSVSVIKDENLNNIINNRQFCPLILNLIDYNKTELIFNLIRPDYVINCAAQSNVYDTINQNIENTFLVNTIAPLRHLEFINKYCKNCKYLSCGSSEQFGEIHYTPQDLDHPFNPINIYGITKNTTHNLIKFYRSNFNLNCSHMIMYNHESLRRSLNFVTRKITNKIAQIKIDFENNEKPSPLEIGNIYSKRDWSSSNDFVAAFWKILNMDKPDDYILSSGQTYTIKQLLDIGFEYINIKLDWNISDNPLDTKAYHDDILLIKVNKVFYRDNDDERFFQGDNSKSKKKLNWDFKLTFKDLINSMIENDYNKLKINSI